MQNYILTIISAALITLGCTQSFILEDNSTPAPKPTPTPELTSAPYAVGDYYNDGKKEGVVFEVWDDGNSGKIVSMTQSAEYLQWSSDEAEQKRLVGADNQTDGAANMAIIKSISSWEDKYPAFKWCADLGEGWYLPAKEELLTIYSNKAAIDANLTEQLTSSWYWSSTEYDYHNSDGVFCAWRVRMYDGAYGSSKSNNYYVRAVSAFSNAKPTPEFTSAPYAVGDYYNDGKKEGVVFDVWDNGNSGKIVSMTQSASTLQWSSDEAEQKRFVGADNQTDGAVNMAIIKAISGWESKYPAFKWCADLGEGWYLPAKEELLTIYSNKGVVNANLVYKLSSSYYWSSTEYDYHTSDGVFCAWCVNMLNGHTTNYLKLNYYCVRAVSAFGNAKPTPEPAPTPTSAIDLSADGTANCYLVQSAGNYKFKVGAPVNNISTADSAEVLWESFGTSETPAVGDLVKDVVYENGYVTFSTADVFKNGNASIAVKDSKGIILWSWHIWCSEEGWNDQVYANNAGTMMDRNLGATSATPGDIGAFGLLYQWGRKDPFMGSCAKEGTTLAASTDNWNVASGSDDMAITIRNPMTFETAWNGGGVPGEGWHTSESEKGLYDPCPVGYRVPNGGENGFWTTALGASSSTSAGTTWDSINDGMYWTLADGKSTAWYPAVGCRSNVSGALNSVGSYGYYWSASPYPSNSYSAYHLYFHNGYVYPADYYNRSNGYSVRCVREYTR